MIKKKDFLKEYNIEKETLKKTGMKWEELNSIYDSYCRIEPQLKKIGKDFVNDYLYDIEKAGIHSYRYRTKKAGHLLEKIIRKKSEQPDQYKYINRKNYYKYMDGFDRNPCILPVSRRLDPLPQLHYLRV